MLLQGSFALLLPGQIYHAVKAAPGRADLALAAPLLLPECKHLLRPVRCSGIMQEVQQWKVQHAFEETVGEEWADSQHSAACPRCLP